ncbi:MAG TPA: hypothetical protein VN026_03610 [Bacteroidia bacterium]|nr:hypothetical protein [Bacteroidia bacterium]
MLTKKLKGGALYVALIISIVIGITLSAFILIGFYNQKQVLSQIALNQLHYNLGSAFNIAQSEFFPEYENNRWISANSETDSIRIKKLQWGAYSLISTETKNHHQYLKQCGLFGVLTPKDTAILVSDKKQQISLAGKINFNGNCYFPKAGIKPVFLEGQSFSTASEINSLLHRAPVVLPFAKNSFTLGIKNAITEFNPNTDSLISSLPELVNNSFSAKTTVFQSEIIHLFRNQLSGNIKIVGNREVIIENATVLNDILITAPKVTIKKGFQGVVQIISTDSIIIEEDCLLNYPSSLTVLNADKNDKNIKGIFVGAKSIIYGSLICIYEKGDNYKAPSHVTIKLDKDCEIYGMLYSTDYAQLQGKIYGTAFCDKLFLITQSALYENHLMNCEIDPKKYASSMVVPGIFVDKKINKCCKWL